MITEAPPIKLGLTKYVLNSVATGYGQPPPSLFDPIYESASSTSSSYSPKQGLAIRLKIERICSRISKSMYFMSDSTEIGNQPQQASITDLLHDELLQIETEIVNSDSSGMSRTELGCHD